jgi:hypothetical protein
VRRGKGGEDEEEEEEEGKRGSKRNEAGMAGWEGGLGLAGGGRVPAGNAGVLFLLAYGGVLS